jgi:hypothetical protein
MIEVEGLEAFRADLEALRRRIAAYADIAEASLADAAEQALLIYAGAAAQYPASLSGSLYRRTGTLGRLWTTGHREVRTGGGALVSGRITNATPYGPWVQDPDRQVAVHRGRWQTTDDVVEEHGGAVKALLDQAASEVAKDLGRGL